MANGTTDGERHSSLAPITAKSFPGHSKRAGDTTPAVGYPGDTMLNVIEQSRAASELLDTRALAAELDRLAGAHKGHERELRTALAQRLKQALAQGRADA